jgi:hypothetical protein
MSNAYTYKVPFTEEELHRDYAVLRMSQSEIAVKYNTDHNRDHDLDHDPDLDHTLGHTLDPDNDTDNDTGPDPDPDPTHDSDPDLDLAPHHDRHLIFNDRFI